METQPELSGDPDALLTRIRAGHHEPARSARWAAPCSASRALPSPGHAYLLCVSTGPLRRRAEGIAARRSQRYRNALRAECG